MEEKIEPNITQYAVGGPYRVRVARRLHEVGQVSVLVDNLELARTLRDQARGLRAAGKDVRQVWIERGLIDPIGNPVDETVKHLCESYVESRRRLSAASDPQISGLDRNTNGLRTTTLDIEIQNIDKHIVGKLGRKHLSELDTKVVNDWGTELAEAGLSFAMQQKLHALLRKIVSSVGAKRRPLDFPWSSLKATHPRSPIRRQPDPTVWGGRRGSKAPSMTFDEGMAIAALMRSCARAVVYLMLLMGFRRGETMGITLGNIIWKPQTGCNSETLSPVTVYDRNGQPGTLWINVERQMNLSTGEIHPWTKTLAGYRLVPVPPSLAVYIADYAQRYHGIDLMSAYRPDPDRLLIVTSTGRDRDGSYMPCSPTTWANWFDNAVQANGYGYDQLGFDIEPRHLRNAFITYHDVAKKLLRMVDAELSQAPEGETLDEKAARLERREAAIEARDEASHVSEADLSAYVGHRRDDDSDQAASAARITQQYADRAIGIVDAERHDFEAVAAVTEQLFATLAGADLVDEPDEHDLTQIIDPDDPAWVMADEAVAELPVTLGSLHTLLRKGRVEGTLVYFSDGDREVPGRRWAIRRSSLEELKERYNGFSVNQTAQITGLGIKQITRLGVSGRLPLHHSPMSDNGYHNRSDVAGLLAELLDLVMDTLPSGDTARASLVHKRVVAVLRDGHPASQLIPMPTRLREHATERLLEILADQGCLTNQQGWYRRAKYGPDVATAASAALAAVTSNRFGPTADPANAAKRTRTRPKPTATEATEGGSVTPGEQ
jgi:hypothetical protein